MDISNSNCRELSKIEAHDTEGGLLGLAVATALQIILVGSLAAGIYASAKAGYDTI